MLIYFVQTVTAEIEWSLPLCQTRTTRTPSSADGQTLIKVMVQ